MGNFADMGRQQNLGQSIYIHIYMHGLVTGMLRNSVVHDTIQKKRTNHSQSIDEFMPSSYA